MDSCQLKCPFPPAVRHPKTCHLKKKRVRLEVWFSCTNSQSSRGRQVQAGERGRDRRRESRAAADGWGRSGSDGGEEMWVLELVALVSVGEEKVVSFLQAGAMKEPCCTAGRLARTGPRRADVQDTAGREKPPPGRDSCHAGLAAALPHHHHHHHPAAAARLLHHYCTTLLFSSGRHQCHVHHPALEPTVANTGAHVRLVQSNTLFNSHHCRPLPCVKQWRSAPSSFFF